MTDRWERAGATLTLLGVLWVLVFAAISLLPITYEHTSPGMLAAALAASLGVMLMSLQSDGDDDV